MEKIRLKGRKLLAEALGDQYLEKRDETTNDFNRPLREFSEAAAFGMIWSRPGLEKKFRSMLCLSLIHI